MCPRVLVFCSFLFLVWGPAAASAQNPDERPEPELQISAPRERPVGRNGLLFGVDLFAGNGLESDAAGAAGLGVHIGWMLSPTLAVMLDTHGAAVGSSRINATDVSSTVLVRSLAAATLQWWPTQRFWLRGGVGPGRVEGVSASAGITPSAELEGTQNGFGTTIATGFELHQGSLFALDLHARYTDIRAGGKGYSNVVAGLGLGWYPHTVALLHSKDRKATTPEANQGKKDKDWNRWILGLGALGGRPFNNDCEDCYWDLAAGMAFEFGYRLTPRLEVSLDTHLAAVGRSTIEGYDAEANALVQGVVGVAVQYWAGRRLWIKGGIGKGEVRESATVTSPEGASVDITEVETGFGVLTAVGYEFHRRGSMGLDVNGRYAGIYGEHLNRASLFLGVGMSWYPF